MLNEPEISHILGVDYGKSKIGLALADSETRMAFAYGTIENNKQLFQKLAEIIEKEGVTKVIVGVPGFKNREMRVIRRFIGGLAKRLGRIYPEWRLFLLMKCLLLRWHKTI